MKTTNLPSVTRTLAAATTALVASVTLTNVPTASAQLVGLGAGTNFTVAPPGMTLAGSAAYQNGVIGPAAYSTTLTGDVSTIQPFRNINDALPHPALTGANGYDYFHAGPLPVEISSLRLTGNYKLVNSGGSPIAPASTTFFYTVFIRQAVTPLTPSQSDPIVMSLFGSRAPLEGNGFVIDTFSQTSADGPYVLAAGADYYFQIGISFNSTIPVVFGAPQYGNSLEFGGPLTSGTLTGFTAAFDYRVVPTPGAAAAFGLGGLLAVRRRR